MSKINYRKLILLQYSIHIQISGLILN